MTQPPLIVLEDICQTYRLGDHSLRVLDHVHLRPEAKERCAIVGASGSGKSTLLNILELLDKAESGRFLLNGRDMSRASADERARARPALFGGVDGLENDLGASVVGLAGGRDPEASATLG
ncbi:hypothetical protein AGMMS50256_26000 [Betaproteobacteria bacterium]|nr:hypothetical protein AGMMS50256_26000 [Betaproteobacteria bacterium]